MEADTFDALDRQLVNALQLDGRASFSRIATVLGVSDQTVARRFRRLRTDGRLRVIGTTAQGAGLTHWYLRLRCLPDAAEKVALALARRPDTAWVSITSGGTEVTGVLRAASNAEAHTLVLRTLPRLPQVVGIGAHCVIHPFLGGTEPWVGNLGALTDDQVAQLMPDRGQRLTKVGVRPAGERTDPQLPLTVGDRAMIAVLLRDGRAGYPELAAATGWSETTTRRRLEELRRRDALRLEVEFDEEAAGFRAAATLWISVAPHSLAAVGEAMAEHAETAFVAATTGATNLVATVVCRDLGRLYDYLTARIGGLRAIRQIETAPHLRLIKREGALAPTR